MLNILPNQKHRAFLATVYGSGLRVSEVVKLRPEHLDSDRMTIRVEQSKGRKDRYTVLSRYCLELLRTYWRTVQPEEWMFLAETRGVICPSTLHSAYSIMRKRHLESVKVVEFIGYDIASPPMRWKPELKFISSKDGWGTPP